MGVEGASFNGFVNDESLWNLLWCFLCKFYYRNRPILKKLGQFENLGFVIMSTRENIRLIARAPFICKLKCDLDLESWLLSWVLLTVSMRVTLYLILMKIFQMVGTWNSVARSMPWPWVCVAESWALHTIRRYGAETKVKGRASDFFQDWWAEVTQVAKNGGSFSEIMGPSISN